MGNNQSSNLNNSINSTYNNKIQEPIKGILKNNYNTNETYNTYDDTYDTINDNSLMPKQETKNVINDKIQDYYSFIPPSNPSIETKLPILYEDTRNDTRFSRNIEELFEERYTDGYVRPSNNKLNNQNNSSKNQKNNSINLNIRDNTEKDRYNEPITIDKPYKNLDLNQDEKQIITSNEIDLSDIDPYNLSGKSPKKINLKKIYEFYIRLRNLNHPDKCPGNEDVYITIVNAIETIQRIEKMKVNDKTHITLKTEYLSEMSKIDIPCPIKNIDIKDNFNKYFNNLFEKNKFIEEDRGYADIMVPSSKSREDIYIENKLGSFNKQDFNTAFKQYKKTDNNEMVVYQVPEPNLYNLPINNLVPNKTDDFTYLGKYTDYKQAFDNSTLISEDTVKIKQVSNLKNEMEARKKETLALTDEQIYAIEEYEKQQKEIEYKEREYFKEREKKIAEWNANMKYLT